MLYYEFLELDIKKLTRKENNSVKGQIQGQKECTTKELFKKKILWIEERKETKCRKWEW